MTEHSRRSYRFRVAQPIVGRFNGVPVDIRDIADGGVQIEHGDVFNRGTAGLLEYTVPGRQKQIRLHGQLLWTRRVDEGAASPRYRSGMKIDLNNDMLNATIDFLVRAGMASIDRGNRAAPPSKARIQLVGRKQPEPEPIAFTAPPAAPGDVAPDVIRVVERARDRLAASFEEAVRWYNRARFSLAEPWVQREVDSIRHKEDVLAVWEYLGRTVDIATIARVFDRPGGR